MCKRRVLFESSFLHRDFSLSNRKNNNKTITHRTVGNTLRGLLVLFSWRVVLGFGVAEVGQENGPDEPVVDEPGSVDSEWDKAPDEENALEEPIEGYQGQNEVGEELGERQGSEHNPVGQPESVILLVPGFDGQDGSVGGICKTYTIADQLCTISDYDHKTKNEARSKNQLPAFDPA